MPNGREVNMSYYSRKVKKIRDILKTNQYPPEFNPERWKFIKCNCYAYALDLPVNDIAKKIFIPGCIADKNLEKEIWTGVSKRVEKDLDFLGISYREDDGKLYNGEYRIAIYYIPTPHDWPIGFHISRQDVNGEWSEKKSWKAKVQKIGEKGDKAPDISEYGPVLEKVLILSK